MQIGRKIYFDNLTGEILVDKGEMSGDVRETSFEEDVAMFPQLRDKSIDFVSFQYGQTPAEYFISGKVFVDTNTKQLVFKQKPLIVTDKQKINSDGVDTAVITVTVNSADYIDNVEFSIDEVTKYPIAADKGVAKFEFASSIIGQFTVTASTEEFGSNSINVEVI